MDDKTMPDEEIVKELSKIMTKSMIGLIEKCIEQRLKQFLPLIKEGLTDDKNT